MTNFKFEQPREAKTVYDEKGQMYAWYGEKIDSGYVVQTMCAIRSTYWCDGHEVPDYDVHYGDFTILREMYEEPPVQKREARIVELENKIKELEEKIKEKEHKYSEISWITNASPEEIIRKKLEGIPEVDYLIKALNNELSIYKVDDKNNLIRRNTDYVAVHLNDKNHPIHFFTKDNGVWKKYNCNDMKVSDGEVAFTSQAEAEKFIVQRLLEKKGLSPEIPIETLKYLSSLFIKYNVPEPDYWQEFVKSQMVARVRNAWDDIAYKYARIKEIKKEIEGAEAKIIKEEDLIKNKSIISLQDIESLDNKLEYLFEE